MVLTTFTANTFALQKGQFYYWLNRGDVVRNGLFREDAINVLGYAEKRQMRTQTDFIIVHHDAIPQTFEHAPINEITAYHMQMFGVFAYHYYIGQNGTIYRMHPEGATLPNCLGYNHNSVAVCLYGNFNQQTPTADQSRALKRVLRYLRTLYPTAQIVGHYELNPGTTCPGNSLTYKIL